MPGADIGDLDDDLVAEYIAKREARTRRKIDHRSSPWPQHASNLLRDIGALDHQGKPTVAGILLFGKNPQSFLPNSGVVFVKFPGVEPRGEARTGGLWPARRN